MRTQAQTVLASLVLLTSCGGSAAGELAAANSPTSAPISTTTLASTTTPTSTSTTRPTSTTAPGNEEPVSDRLTDGLLTLNDLPEGFIVNNENHPLINAATGEVGTFGIGVCDGTLDAQPAIEGRFSAFSYPTGILGFPPEGVIEEVSNSVRIAADGTTFNTADRLAATVEPCLGTSIDHDAGTATVAAIEVPEERGVSGAGFQLIFTDGDFVGRSFLFYSFQLGRLDASLFISGAAPQLDQLPTLGQPIVTAAQQRLADCATDTDVCAA